MAFHTALANQELPKCDRDSGQASWRLKTVSTVLTCRLLIVFDLQTADCFDLQTSLILALYMSRYEHLIGSGL